MQNEYIRIIDRLLDMKPDPIAAHVLHKIRGYDMTSSECAKLYDQVCAHPNVRKLEDMQNADGFWPPFHRDTELIIRRLLSYGLGVEHPALKKARDYLVRLLEGSASTGQYERQDDPRWYPVMFEPVVAAAMLSLIDPNHALVRQFRSLWASFAEAAFASGRYDESADRSGKAEHFGFAARHTVPPQNYYNLLLLAPRGGQRCLSAQTDRALVEHCLFSEGKLYYVYNERPGDPVEIGVQRRDSRNFWHWIRALTIIAQYDGWKQYAPHYVDWIMDQRNENGLWEFPSKFDFAISNSWRGKNKQIDSSIHVLQLLMRS